MPRSKIANNSILAGYHAQLGELICKVKLRIARMELANPKSNVSSTAFRGNNAGTWPAVAGRATERKPLEIHKAKYLP